jgi:hypothetical protein
MIPCVLDPGIFLHQNIVVAITFEKFSNFRRLQYKGYNVTEIVTKAFIAPN